MLQFPIFAAVGSQRFMIIQREKHNLRQGTEIVLDFTDHIEGNNPIFFCPPQRSDQSRLKRFS
jgi:hypothetical protein